MEKSSRVALVTGATGNLGHVLATRFEATFDQVVRVERSFAQVAGERLGDVQLLQAESTSRLFERVLARCGRLDVAVHTVGAFRASGPIDALDLEAFRYMFEVNLSTTLHFLRAAVASMRPRGFGRIVVVSGTAALQGTSELAAYSASKAAQLRLVESAAADLARSGVTVNAVLPGTMDTPENRAAMPNADRSVWVSLDEVADVIAYLASDGASAVNGRAITVSRA